MNNTALGILSALFILTGSWALSYFNIDGSSTSGNATYFSVMDGAFKTKNVDAFSFGVSGSKVTIPVATEGELKKVAAHLKSNEDRMLNLVGNYYVSEKMTGDNNLGEARAEAIKAALVKYKAPAESIITSGKRLSSSIGGDKIYNAVSFDFMEKKNEAVENPTPVDVVFSPSTAFVIQIESADMKLSMTDELKDYLEEALNYLGQNKGTIINISGYTDNSGTTKKIKYNRSRSNARVVREFLKKNGVENKQIKIVGMEDADPVASNNTEEGRAKNRRAEITIK